MNHFKFKDTFTAISLLAAFASVVLAIEGYFREASYLIFLNILVLDLFDGWVARLTNTSNDFGKHFDAITDFVGCTLCVSFIIYIGLKDYSMIWAATGAFIFLFSGTIRWVRSQIENIKAEGYFIGFIRNGSAMINVALLNSFLIQEYHLYELSLVCIVLTSVLCLTHIPYWGNDKSKAVAAPRVKAYLYFAVLAQIGLSFMGNFFEGIVLWILAYMVSPLCIVDKAVFENIKRQLKEQN